MGACLSIANTLLAMSRTRLDAPHARACPVQHAPTPSSCFTPSARAPSTAQNGHQRSAAPPQGSAGETKAGAALHCVSTHPVPSARQEEIHISKYKGKVVGVDAYVWLHRGAYGCAQQLSLGQPTTR